MKLIIQIGLYIFLILIIFLLITSKTGLFNIRSFVVLTGSMEPALSRGSILLVQKKPEYHKGEVITFYNGSADVTHRILSIKTNGNRMVYQTKGDANETADPVKIFPKSIYGSVLFHIAYIGAFVMFLKTLPGLFLFILLPGMIFILTELQAIVRELNIKNLKIRRENEI